MDHNNNKSFNPLIIPYITAPDDMPVPEGAAVVDLKCHNWGADFPYAPEVSARLWHNGRELFVAYEVDEDAVAALAAVDNGEVWKDSCCEMFIDFDGATYYNIEANCIGKVLVSNRRGREEGVVMADGETLARIRRYPSLGSTPFESRPHSGKWTLTLVIPASTFFKHDIAGFGGVKARCNFYKCGDKLPRPHFMSWQPVGTPTPDFHRPEFFGDVIFE